MFRWFSDGKTKVRFLSVGNHLQKIMQLLAENYRRAPQKCYLSVKENILRKNSFFKVIQKNSNFWEKDFDWAVKCAFHVSRWTFWETFLGKKNKIGLVSKIWSNNFRTFGELFGQSKQNFTSLVESSDEKLISWKRTNFFFIFVHWPEKISASWQENFLKKSQNCNLRV